MTVVTLFFGSTCLAFSLSIARSCIAECNRSCDTGARSSSFIEIPERLQRVFGKGEIWSWLETKLEAKQNMNADFTSTKASCILASAVQEYTDQLGKIPGMPI